jgi:hypothetical protein
LVRTQLGELKTEIDLISVFLYFIKEYYIMLNAD